jgi:N-acetylglucosaminyl-diphospho-decaprenol L-rhamnosyltransferase
MPNLSIVVVSWNVRNLLRRCLASVATSRDELPIEVIVVDSASADGSADMVEAEFPWVQVLRQNENVGFSRGSNLGLAEASGRILLLLNPDTEVVADALARMVHYLEAHSRVGALGPMLLYPDGRIQSSRRRFPTLATALFESTWLQPVAPPSLLRRYYVLDRPDDAISEVDWVTGACLMVRREAYEAAGPLDEGYFMYSEEMEWQRRIQTTGWRIIYYPEAKVIHHEGKSSEQVAAERHIYFQSSKLRYFYHYHGRLAGRLLRAFLLLSYTWQLLLEAGKGALGHKRPLRRQRVAAYWQVLRTGLPPAGARKQRAR